MSVVVSSPWDKNLCKDLALDVHWDRERASMHFHRLRFAVLCFLSWACNPAWADDYLKAKNSRSGHIYTKC